MLDYLLSNQNLSINNSVDTYGGDIDDNYWFKMFFFFAVAEFCRFFGDGICIKLINLWRVLFLKKLIAVAFAFETWTLLRSRVWDEVFVCLKTATY